MDFDKTYNRYNTYSTQWDYTVDRFGSKEVLPFSISDTDFQVPSEVKDALKKVIEHGIYGYTRWNHSDFKGAIVDFYERHHATFVNPDWVVYSPSVMYTIAKLIKMLSDKNDGVVTFSPMYDAFFKVIQENDRTLLSCALKDDYTIDFDSLKEQLKQAKVLLLCSPHNPTGRVWTLMELQKIIELCKKYKVWILSDEIHSDIIHTDYKHIPIVNKIINYNRTILITSPSKTFNTASLIGSYALIPNDEIREKFMLQTRYKDFLNSASRLGIEALMVGYNQCDYYIDELVEYIRGNLEYLREELAKLNINYEIPEATYLAWINVSNLNIDMDILQKQLVEYGKVGIMLGAHYGDNRYLRLNCGCPREKLVEGVKRFKETLMIINNKPN